MFFFLFDRDLFLFQSVWVIVCRHRFHSIKTAALAYHISNDIIPAVFIHLNSKRKLQPPFSHKCYYVGNSIIRVGKAHNQYFSLARWQSTSGAMYEPQAGSDKWVNIFFKVGDCISSYFLRRRKGSGIFSVAFEVPVSLFHLCFHLRVQRVNTLCAIRRCCGRLHNLQHFVM